MVALDFDLTVIDIHTGGRWRRSADELARHTRPFFRCLIPECLRNDIMVAIATFSTQSELIESVLATIVPADVGVPIFGGDLSIDGFDQGKQSQLLSSSRWYDANHGRRGRPILSSSVLLVDDDRRNIAIARRDGYRTVQFDPDREELGQMLMIR